MKLINLLTLVPFVFSIQAAEVDSATANTNAEASFVSQQKIFDSPVLLTNEHNYQMNYQVKGSKLKRLTLDVSIDSSYANLSIFDGEKLIVDNINIPTKGKHTLNLLVDFESTGIQTLTFVRRTADIKLHNIKFEEVIGLEIPSFADVSKAAAFETENTYKYGGPSVGDIDADGDYDFVLNNHNHIPTQLVINNGDGTVSIERLFTNAQDFHGSAIGDYDADGDLDIMVAKGGGSGSNPTSYMLLNNDEGKFTDVSQEVGITVPTRGRSPRWVDLDLDGDLDLVFINAKRPNYDGPRHIFYKNNDKGKFTQQLIPGIEKVEAERTLITDFNNDGIDDILLFAPLSLWQGNGDFTFTEVTKTWLPKGIDISEVNAVTDVDVNNDGLFDLYLAGGKTHYKLSQKSIDFNPKNEKLDIRDDGEKGSTLINFTADDAINLSAMELTYRLYDGGFAIFLGKNKTRKIVKAKGFQPTQLPEEMKHAATELTIAPSQAEGWPEERLINGMYIGYLGDGKWQAEWVRDQNIYWTITFSLTGVTNVDYDWTPNNRNQQDILLVNKGDRFVDATKEWNIPLGINTWGVTHADFNNDGWQDLFVYRYGYLRERIADLLLLNNGKGRFEIITSHGAFDREDTGHGDMGQAFDFDLDGQVDMLNGSEEEGTWYLYQNKEKLLGNYILINVGYSPKSNIDPYSALVTVEAISGEKYLQRVGSAGEVFSQSLLNTLHFGLGTDTKIKSATIRWRNGEVMQLGSLKVNTLHKSADAQDK
ncbi:CRTAC1 family protein [Colwellia echini]|uniref:CRTAC1 family protein n=1 Tax=Colwellia echini TaxID=1982103 RepID=A0ABY3N129_9GAMM|nr:CRTAC1 family protein [Colwellia echini]TYK67201.1 CRTAC1 family protein [Colwellia echini]